MTRLWLCLLVACGGSIEPFPKASDGPADDTTPDSLSDTDTDTDTDSDTDTDTDTDSDTDTDTDSDTDTDTGTPPVSWANGDPAVPPTLPAVPAPLATACADSGMTPAPITDDPDNEVVVDGTDDIDDTHVLSVTTAGWYHLWNDPPANDLDDQWNESIVVRIRNTTFPAGSTVLTNCDVDFATLDGDNVAPVPLAQYLGTFWFDAGTNTIDVVHLCSLVLAGQCTNLEELSDPDSTCDQDDNRLRMVSDGLCIQQP